MATKVCKCGKTFTPTTEHPDDCKLCRIGHRPSLRRREDRQNREASGRK
jgi:hypothetical protein